MKRVLGKTAFLFSVIGLVVLGMDNSGEAGVVEITTMTPAPNYPLCTDSGDRQQLSDGETVSYPMWKRKGCVGWNQQGVVTIAGVLPTTENGAPAGRFRIHVGAGEHAGVFPPERIDIYSTKPPAQTVHVTGFIAGNTPPGRKDHWLTIPVAMPSEQFWLVLRPGGVYLFVDEIQWQPADDAAAGKAAAEADPVEDIQADALERHRNELARRAEARAIETNRWLDNVIDRTGILFWRETDLFGRLSGAVPAAAAKETSVRGYCHGYAAEKESMCIGAAHAGDLPREVTVTLKGDPATVKGLYFGTLGRVLAADGTLVYDPIVPLEPGSRISLSPYLANYFWITADLTALAPGSHTAQLVIMPTDGKPAHEVPLTVRVDPWKPAEKHKPSAVGWGYVSDLPVWSDPAQCVRDMTGHGMNVFVVHPSRIPAPQDGKDVFLRKAILFEKDLRLLRGRGRMILFYLAWSGRTYRQQEVAEWVRWVQSATAASGLEPAEWALYPIDEPRGKRWDTLLRYAGWIKAVDASIRVYANPIDTNSETVDSSALKKAEPVIDIWQPEMGLAEKREAFFSGYRRTAWWVYQNPPRPAKSASPLADYRMLAWKAWQIGAAGIGFWAYSDTTGTSAWNDFDGRRPDYAVVYESANGPVSSRRWEAFREGVEDYQMLAAACDERPELAETLRREVGALPQNTGELYSAIEAVRRDLITGRDRGVTRQTGGPHDTPAGRMSQ